MISLQPSVSVESVMRGGINMSSIRQDFRMAETAILHPEYAIEKAKATAEYQSRQTAVLSLPALQQAALLQMHESQVKRAVIARLLEEWSQDKPQAPDYRALVDKGFAVRNLGKRFHELTPAGIVAVKQLETALCLKFDIHLLIDCGQVDWQQKFRCTCGQSYFVRRSPTAPGNARRQWAADHATRDGMTRLKSALKPSGMAAEG